MPESFMRDALEQMLSAFKDSTPDIAFFTSFNFSSSFFEANVIPLLLGISVDELKGTLIARSALNEALERIRVVAVCDRSAHPEPKGSLRYGLMSVGLGKGRFHPKIILMSGTLVSGHRGLWLAVGSGNLTLLGWAGNREIVGITPVLVKHRPELMPLLRWLLLEAEHRIAWIDSTSEADVVNGLDLVEEGRTREVLKDLISALENHAFPDADTPGAPTLHLAMPSAVRGGAATPLLSALAGGEAWSKVTVVSPFWGDVARLVDGLCVDQCRFVPSLRSDHGYAFPLETLKSVNGIKWKYSFHKFKADAGRYTHAKAILLEQGKLRVICLGSANFTAAALSPENGTFANVEAMLRYSYANGDPWQGLFSALQGALIGPEERDPEQDGAPQLPPFDAEVACDWQRKKFFCRLKILSGTHVRSISMEIAGESRCLVLKEEKEQRFETGFRGTLPVRIFSVHYVLNDGVQFSYRGLVTQLSAEDDELGYRPRPQLGKVLEYLRLLDPRHVSRAERHRTDEWNLEDDEEGTPELSFDLFKFFQGTYKMRRYYEAHPELDPYSEMALGGIPVLYRAVSLQSAQSNDAKVGRYMQLSELLDTVRSLERSSGGQLRKRLEREITGLEKEMVKLVKSSPSFTKVFGMSKDATKAKAFLDWFRNELKEQPHVPENISS